MRIFRLVGFAVACLIVSIIWFGQSYAQTSFIRDNTVIQLRDNDWWYYGLGRGSDMVTLQDIKKIKDEKPVKQKLLFRYSLRYF